MAGSTPLLKRRSSLIQLRTHMGSVQWLNLVLFAFFILTRAVHPLLIDASKRDGKVLYVKNTVVVAAKVLIVVLMNVVAWMADGAKGLRNCWQPRCLFVFGIIGAVYALGDFLEMLSMAKLSGGVYQILLQAKLLITAMLLWYLKGTRQTPLQSHVLLAMFLAMSAFVILDGDSSSSGGGSLPLFAVLCVVMKVAVSCYCAVLSEKYLKEFKDMPFYAKISALSSTWAAASVFLCFTAEREAVAQGFFANWNPHTVLVVASFIVKTLSTQYLLQKLDSVQKNIGEALAVIVIYVSQVAMPSFDKTFELSIFLLAVLVVALVKTYLLSSPSVAMKSVPRKSKTLTVVNLNPRGTQTMMSAGRSTVRCEVAGELPQGVFYGMLGDIHPVCGNTNPDCEKQCELMFVGEEEIVANGEKNAQVERELPYMPRQSLTVLGHIRDTLPKNQLSPDQFATDADKARQGIVRMCECV